VGGHKKLKRKSVITRLGEKLFVTVNNCYSLICNDNINNTPTHNQTHIFMNILLSVVTMQVSIKALQAVVQALN
jgi:hypothetical protein